MMMRSAPSDMDAPEWQTIIQQLELEGVADPRGNLRDAWLMVIQIRG